MKITCPQCLEKKEVKSIVGRLCRLECKHLVVTPPTLEEQIKQEEEKEKQKILEEQVRIEKEEKAKTVIDDDKFHNRKTKDTPYPFQEKGIQFAITSGFKCLIADEQGLGKTIQAIGVADYAMKNCFDDFFPALIVCKSGTKTQWMVQMLNWGGIDFLPQIIDDSKTPPVEGFNTYIASYDIFRRFSKKVNVVVKTKWGMEHETTKKESPFYDFPFKTIIMDEVQAIKGESERTGELKRICEGKNVIALSGTPIKNNADEYYTILHMLAPQKFPSRKGYRDYWVRQETINGFTKYTGIRYPEKFKEYTSDIIIRRTRDEVKEEIGLRVTKANRIFYHVDFESDKLKAAYKAAEAEFIREMEKSVKSKNPIDLIGALSVMRHLVGLNKIQPTVDLAIEYLLENPSGKLLIFAHHKDVMDAIHKLLTVWCLDGGYQEPLLYHSGLNQEERYAIVTKYISDPSIPFMIGSTLAMGEGVDRLQEACNDCIVAERQWNPANEEQAESRLVRIGQKKDFVNATYPTASGTIDEYFTEIVETKRKAMKETLDGKELEWSEAGLLTALYDAIMSKGRTKLTRGW